ncbi:MAG TPA: glycosyltransferase family 2 protein [Candidatus Deferrimicrobium sp.]|nr:glycosyltransferase family 2 protein [Candidatus Deferrimicrobium sp.]
MGEILVSTIIPTYNRAELVVRAVNSALENSVPGDEVIVVDDGSTDNTEEALARFRERIRYLRILNSGAGAARNHAVRLARNPLVALLDSDDEWLPGKLEMQRRFMAARPDVLYCFTDFMSHLSDGTTVRRAMNEWIKRKFQSWDDLLSPGILYSTLAPLPEEFEDFKVYIGDFSPLGIRAGHINTDTVVVRRQQAGEALHFTEGVSLYEEQECYGRLARAGLVAYLDAETVRHYSGGAHRLTKVDALPEATARIEAAERVWGSCAEYMAAHGDEYKRVVDQYRIKKAASLISLGRVAEARAEHRLIGHVPPVHRLLAHLPGPAARSLLGIRRFLRAMLGGG